MLTEDPKDNPMIILSDDEEDDLVLNDNGKRPYAQDEDGQDYDSEEEEEGDFDHDDEGEEFDEDEEGYDEEDEGEFTMGTIRKNQTLPEDHESVIFSERAQVNPYQRLDNIFNQFKAECVPVGMEEDEIETSFACGWPLKDNAPDIAMNVEGVVGPITFPLSPKDTKRITDGQPAREQDNACFELETNKILLNLSFQEYIFETILPDVLSYLGVDKQIAKESRLQANRFYICEEGKEVKLPEQLPKGAYGTVFIILPSDFNGGDILTNYKDHDIMFQPETDTLSESYYMAWYNDVACRFQPIISGHQASLSFSLIYDGDDASITAETLQERRLSVESGQLTPTQVEKTKSFLQEAVHLFKSETMANSKYPFFYMLNYSYTSPNVKIDTLKRSDKLLAKAFEKVAEEAGFNIYVGSLEREVEAKVNEDTTPTSSTEDAQEEAQEKDAAHVDKKMKLGGSGNSSDLENDCPMDEEGIYLTQSVVYDEYILTTLTDNEGKNILPNPVAIDAKKHQPLIQGVNWYSRCKPENEDLSGAKNAKDVTVKYWYPNNTALVFVPKASVPGLIEMSKESDY